ncbi:MAG: two-component system response regulator, partial [Pseudobdellovibrionaceae bacterium]
QRTMRTKPVILAVEDQRFSQKLLMYILKDYTVYIAASSAEALLLYMEKCPDILLLDIDLPDLSGHEFAQLINKIDPEHYIIMVSANHSKEDIIRARQNRSKRFIVKPYEKEELIRVVDDYKMIKKLAKKREDIEKNKL